MYQLSVKVQYIMSNVTGAYKIKMWLQEGKLRVLQYDGAHAVNGAGPSYFPEETIVGVSQ